MKWFNLKQNNCPKCNRTFGYRAVVTKKGFIVCDTPKCEFVISEKRYSEIVNSQINADLERKWDAMENELIKNDYFETGMD